MPLTPIAWMKVGLNYLKLFVHLERASELQLRPIPVEFLVELKRAFLILNNEETESKGS